MDPETQSKFMHLLERVHEPLHWGPRGTDGNIYYRIIKEDAEIDTTNEGTTTSRARRGEVRQGSGREWLIRHPGNNGDDFPDLTEIGKACPRKALFSYFNPRHYWAANELQTVLMKPKDREDFLSMAVATRDHEAVNTQLWTHAFSHAILRRQDMRGFRMPAVWEIMPDQFIPMASLKEAERKHLRRQMDDDPNASKSSEKNESSSAVPEESPGIMSFGDNPEKNLDYFREDIGVNSHHYHWHLVYVKDAPPTGPESRDRKGELFYYMHHNLIARYDAERLANGLLPTVAIDYGLADPIKEAYFPKIGSISDGSVYGPRQENTVLKNIYRTDGSLTTLRVDLDDVRKWKERIYDAIDLGHVIRENTGTTAVLDEETGIDILGDIIGNGGQTTPFPRYYGYMHGLGHMLIAYQNDPENRFDTEMGVMGTTTSAMRDPVFYRLHKFMDDIFNYYKIIKLPPYTPDKLNWHSVDIDSIMVITGDMTPNNLFTHWTETDIEISRGLRCQVSKTPVIVPLKHLNHEPFHYRIMVTNREDRMLLATVRIFMAPAYDISGHRLKFEQQRLLFFEMDKFLAELSPGKNEILRKSEESTVTIPWSQGFSEIEHWLAGTDYKVKEAVCGCGWPHHLLIPRGTEDGMKFDIFVMLTNGSEDLVPKTRDRMSSNSNNNNSKKKPKCKESIGYCGILSELYPDKKPMGFPFDRSIHVKDRGMYTLNHFAEPFPNMDFTEVTVIHLPNKKTKIHKNVNENQLSISTRRRKATTSEGSTSDWVHLDRDSDMNSDNNLSDA